MGRLSIQQYWIKQYDVELVLLYILNVWESHATVAHLGLLRIRPCLSSRSQNFLKVLLVTPWTAWAQGVSSWTWVQYYYFAIWIPCVDWVARIFVLQATLIPELQSGMCGSPNCLLECDTVGLVLVHYYELRICWVCHHDTRQILVMKCELTTS